jgi:hypothetical protein
MPTNTAPDTPDSQPAQPTANRRFPMLRMVGWIMGVPLFGLVILWETLAVYYSNLPRWACPIAALVVAAGSAAILLFLKPRWRRLLAFAAVFALAVDWWFEIPPSNSRDWQPDVAVLPWAEVEGNRLAVHNIRFCDYRSESDYDVRHYDRTFDLDKLRSVDLFLIYWGSPHIAHTMLSFGFEGDQYLCFSIETRKEKGEDYSTVKGFFRQYELTYVVADERDLVRLRTNFRHEQVYLFRLQTDLRVAQGVLLDYFKAVNSLKGSPEWYNALVSNCTTNIRGHTRPYASNKSWDWRLLLNGHLDEMIYERGAIDRSLPLAELKARSLVNDRALAAGNAEDFSRRIREGNPGMQLTLQPAEK